MCHSGRSSSSARCGRCWSGRWSLRRRGALGLNVTRRLRPVACSCSGIGRARSDLVDGSRQAKRTCRRPPTLPFGRWFQACKTNLPSAPDFALRSMVPGKEDVFAVGPDDSVLGLRDEVVPLGRNHLEIDVLRDHVQKRFAANAGDDRRERATPPMRQRHPRAGDTHAPAIPTRWRHPRRRRRPRVGVWTEASRMPASRCRPEFVPTPDGDPPAGLAVRRAGSTEDPARPSETARTMTSPRSCATRTATRGRP